MKKHTAPILIVLTVAFAAFTLGFFLGQNRCPEAVTLSIPESMQTVPEIASQPVAATAETAPQVVFPINIMTAGKEELMVLPGIGEVLAQRILDYREETGGFSRIEDIMNVEGIGKKRFESIYDLITIGG